MSHRTTIRRTTIRRIAARAALAGLVTASLGVAAQAANIEGTWRTQSGANASIASCGGAYCIDLTSGEHAGKRIGRVQAASGNKYTGTVTDPANGKEYSGSAIVEGNALKLSGCVARVLCRTQNWTRR